MKKRKYSKLKRHPLVRWIRRVLRFFNGLFKPKKSFTSSSYSRQISTDEYEHQYVEPLTSVSELDRQAKDGLITVGELLAQIKWQISDEIDRDKSSDLSTSSRTRDVSLN
jgi:hypothetical protein